MRECGKKDRKEGEETERERKKDRKKEGEETEGEGDAEKAW